jgi:lysozyme
MASETLVGLVAEFEGFRAKAYRCPAGVWTIGYGETKGVKPGDVVTEEAAKAQLAKRLDEFQRGVVKSLNGAATTPNQLDAMTSLAYNIGLGAFQKSSVLRYHCSRCHREAAEAFGLWVKAAGKKLPGLVRRRAAEARLYALPV